MALSLTHAANKYPGQLPSHTGSLVWLYSSPTPLHQLSKDLLSRISCDSADLRSLTAPPHGTDSFKQLNKGLLSRCSRNSFRQLSKGLLSRSYYDSADNMSTTGGLSTGVTESPPQTQQGFAEPTLATYVQPQDSVEGLSLTHTPHSTETQGKKVAESGSPQTAQGLGRRMQLSLAHFPRHRDSAEGCS